QVNNWRSTFAQYQLLLGDTGVNVLTVIEEAAIPTVPAGNQGMMQVALAASIGLMLALGAAFLIEYLDDTVKSPQDVERKTGLPTFGVIIRFPPSADGEGPVTALEPRSSIAEGYRVLRTNLQFATLGLNKPSTVLLVTSAQPTEGKTTTVANLGVSLAQAGKKVLLVDADLRRPSLHKLFKLSKDIGLTSLLIEREANLDYVVHKTGIENLSVLPSGPVPANPAEVLGFPEMSALIERLRGLADYVVLDSPPVLSVADTSVLAQKVDGVLMVVEAGLTRTGMFERAVSVLQGVKAKLLGSILTKVGAHRGAYSYDYYYYYSSYYTEDGTHKRTRRHRDRSLLGRIRHWFRRGRRSEHRSSSGTSASGAAPPAPDGAAGPATLAEGAAPVRSLAAGEASARGGAACAAPGEPPPAEGSPARPFDQPLEPPPEDEEESPEGATVALTLRPASADRPQVLTTVLDEAAPRPTEPPESVTAPPLPFPAAAEQEAPAAPWVPPEGPLPFVPLAEEPAARPAPAPLPAEEPAPAAPPVEAAPPPSPPAEQPEPEAPSAPARRRFSFWPFRRRTSPPPAPPVPASPAPTTEALLATEPPETVPAPHEPAAAGPPPQPAPPLPAPAEPLVPVPPVGLAPHAIEPAAESPLPPEPLEYDEAEQEAAASVLPLPVTALPPEPPTVLPMIADDLAPATAPGEPELMIAPSESPLPPEPPEYEEAEEEAAASVLPLPPAGPPPEPPAILPSTTEDLAPAMAPGEPELMIAPAEPEPPAAQPGPELRQEPAPPPAELEPAITAPLAAEPEPEPALPAPEPPAPLAVEPAEPAVAPTAVERQPAPPVPCPPATPADAETAEADALFAEALDLYRHHELKG
ncbi:MAG TPA: polysaccharide biosynthesis tyrosine autokinase, partial [Anaerolineae bacterium]|nr:polysaccharide biosynthesis tyrosine autokinase [Anaerolineae bacterium]